MRSVTDSLNLSSTNMASNLQSDGVYVGQALNLSISAIWTGTPTGTLKLQGSNDAGNPNLADESQRDDTVTNWIDVPNASTSISGAAGSALYQVSNCGFNFVRLVYVAGSGSGTVTHARICIKGF